MREIQGGLFEGKAETGNRLDLRSVKLLWPCDPGKVLAVGLNYKSHLGNRPAPKNPEIFFKATSSLTEPEGAIVIPAGAQNVHFEGELVLVMGKKARRVSVSEAESCIFGYTCGNDVSERDWQKNDLQWWRAKGSDTFAPLGPAIAVGLDYRKSRLQTRLNGKAVQSCNTSELIHNTAKIVSFMSKHVTLKPGDVIFSGTSGVTQPIKPGDEIVATIEKVGTMKVRVRTFTN